MAKWPLRKKINLEGCCIKFLVFLGFSPLSSLISDHFKMHLVCFFFFQAVQVRKRTEEQTVEN